MYGFGFFLYKVLNLFIPICEIKKDIERAEKYKGIMNDLKKSVNTNGWDGRWYKRAFMDNGDILGSLQNEECRIDSIAQSWATISGAGDNDKKYISLESLENHLIDRENGLIKLLDPPFEKGKLKPGYIRSYVPGTRENGGQYTHECCSCVQFLHRLTNNCVLALLNFTSKSLNVQKARLRFSRSFA